jgi:hypothetical protein
MPIKIYSTGKLNQNMYQMNKNNGRTASPDTERRVAEEQVLEDAGVRGAKQ